MSEANVTEDQDRKQSVADYDAPTPASTISSVRTAAVPLISVISNASLKPDDSLKRVAFFEAAVATEQATQSGVSKRDYGHGSDSEISMQQYNENHLLYLGKVTLQHHPIRIRHLPYSTQRLLVYGVRGFQEMTPTVTAAASASLEPYSLETVSWQHKLCDLVQTSDLAMYALVRSRKSDKLVRFDELMTCMKKLKMGPFGCVSSLAANHSGTYLYATNEAYNCVLRICTSAFNQKQIERYGTLWRPFDCCISQPISLPNGTSTQFLFVSNIDAGIAVFNTESMALVAECGGDLSPGAKYLTYDPKRSVLFVSSSSDRQLRCYRFDPRVRSGQQLRPKLHKIDDFMVAKRKSAVRSGGPQCIMWDSSLDQLTVLSWSQMKGRFLLKVFRINLDDTAAWGNSFLESK